MITELRRTGAGTLEDTPVVFKFTGAQHSASLDDLMLQLKVNSVRTVMPGGNSEVVEQMLSAAWEPFELVGEWNDMWGNRVTPTLAGVTRVGSFAMSTFGEFADLVMRMSKVRVELDALSFVGVLQSLKIRYRTKSRIGWACTVSPHKNETMPGPRPRLDFSQSIPKWIADAEEIGERFLTSFEDMTADVLLATPRVDSFTRILLEINDGLDRLQGISQEGFGTDVEDKLLLTATTFRRVRGASLQAHLALSKITTPLDVAFDDALMSIRHSEWVADSIVHAWTMIGTCTRAERDVLRRAGRKSKSIYYPRRGESLEKISLRFYGTADNWRRIYDANNLDSLVLDGTEELFIPEDAR